MFSLTHKLITLTDMFLKKVTPVPLEQKITMSNFYKWETDDLLLSLYVQPNATSDELVGEYDNKLKVRITALPIDNKANKHLLKYLAKIFSVAPSSIKLIKGENQRTKLVRIYKPIKLPEFIKTTK